MTSLAFIDRGIENMPSYMDLYRRWESQQWSVGDLDFTLDREDWLKASDLDRKATLLVAPPLLQRRGARDRDAGAFRLGGRRRPRSKSSCRRRWSTRPGTRSSSTGGGARWSAPTPRILKDLLAEIRPDANEGYNTLFYDRLPSTAQRMASNPKDFDAFVEGVTIYQHHRGGHHRANRPALRARVDA